MRNEEQNKRFDRLSSCSCVPSEYLYWRLKAQSTIPQAGLDMIRLHSCYPLHREGAYRQFFAKGDERKVENVLAFNPYDVRL